MMYRTLMGILLAAGLLLSCASYQSEIRRRTPGLETLSIDERNELAVVQILLVKNGGLVTGGSGCFVNEEGALVTAAHIIEPAKKDKTIVILVNYNGTLYQARVRGFTPMQDLALLEVKTRVPVPCVHFVPCGLPLDENSVTFLALPPSWGLFQKNPYQTQVSRLVIRNHRAIRWQSPVEFLTNPETEAFLKGLDLERILAGPEGLEILSEPTRLASLALPEESALVLLFFLGGVSTRVFYRDPDCRMLAGYSGGVWFDEAGRCLGLFQEILVLFKPNPASRYLRPDRPPEESMLFPLVESMLCAGQGADGICAFLQAHGVAFFRE